MCFFHFNLLYLSNYFSYTPEAILVLHVKNGSLLVMTA